MKAKLKSFEPLMHEGEHAIWNSPNGILYKFKIEFDNGTTGSGQSPKQTPNWSVGKEYEFNVTQNGSYTNIRGMKAVDEYNVSKGGSSEKRPEVQHAIILQSSLERAIEYHDIEGFEADIKEQRKIEITHTAKYFADWIMKESGLNK